MCLGSAFLTKNKVDDVVVFGATVVSLSCDVCNVGVLWRNGWMDPDKAWHAGIGIALDTLCYIGTQVPVPQRGTGPQFSAHICCGQMARWIKMPLRREVGLHPSSIVLDGDPAPPKRGTAPSFRPMSIVAKRLDAISY